VTIQAVPVASDALMLLTAAVLLVLAVATLVQLARRRAAATAAAIVVVYGAVDLAVGFSSRPLRLAPGDFKCFDDWYATMKGSPRARTVLLEIQLQNRGRGRAMRSDRLSVGVGSSSRSPRRC
jgi:hypothetical protein